MTQIADSKTIIDLYTKRLNKTKWQVIFRADNGIQVKRLKRANKLGIWAGLVLLPFWGIGFVFWILVIIDYLFQQEIVTFITVDQMIRQFQEAK